MLFYVICFVIPNVNMVLLLFLYASPCLVFRGFLLTYYYYQHFCLEIFHIISPRVLLTTPTPRQPHILIICTFQEYTLYNVGTLKYMHTYIDEE